MKISDIKMVAGKRLVLAKPADVDRYESKNWITFPEGYRHYITRLGEGVLGSFVRIYPTWRIGRELAEWRRRIGKYWFWDRGARLLPKERALECTVLGDTLNGDELVFHPNRPNRLFVLPRDHERIFEAGEDLLSAIEWMCSSGKLIRPFTDRRFEPFDSRRQAAAQPSSKVVDPEGESLDDLLELGQRWRNRHGARRLARKDLLEKLGAGMSSKLLSESLVLDGDAPTGPGYAASWIISDKRGRELGTFYWHMTDDSHGSLFQPAEARKK